MDNHLPDCRYVWPRELLEPGEELPEGVPEDIGFQKCAEGCPVLAQTLERARGLAEKHGWLPRHQVVWPRELLNPEENPKK